MASNRDLKKRKLKSRIIDGNADRYFDDSYSDDSYSGDRRYDEDPESIWKKKKKNRRIIIIAVIVLIVAAAVSAFLIHRYAKYSEYEITWEKPLSEGSFTGIEYFGDNVLKYSRDGVMYFDRSGTERWVDSYEMKAPAAYVNGDYACIADIRGFQINIYNEALGLVGTAKTVLPLTKAVVAGNGTVAAVAEDEDAAYILFFKKDGSTLDISVKTIMGGDGYPMDIALSPGGTQLLAAYSFIDGGQLKSRVVFYDFSEIGKSIPNRLVGGFEEPFAESMIARVRFINQTSSYAVADDGIYFFSSRNVSSPEIVKTIKIDEEIETVFHSDSYVGLVTANSDGEKEHKLKLFRPDGNVAAELEFDNRYLHACADDRYVYFTGEDSCLILSTEGVVKYDGPLEDAARCVISGKLPGGFIFSNSSYIREYRFR